MREAKPGIRGSFIGFDLGNLCSWPSMWSLCPAEIGIDSCVKEILGGLQRTALPLIGHVNDDKGMYDFLVQTGIDAFLPANGVVLTAEAMFLGKRLGFSGTRVVEDLAPFLRLTSFPMDDVLTVKGFFKEVWARA